MAIAMLKVKIKSLAAEARIIRHQERRSKGILRNELHEHRIGIVRSESRHSHLAYAILRGRPSPERTCKSRPDFEKVSKMTKRFGTYPGFAAKDVESWYDHREDVDAAA